MSDKSKPSYSHAGSASSGARAAWRRSETRGGASGAPAVSVGAEVGDSDESDAEEDEMPLRRISSLPLQNQRDFQSLMARQPRAGSAFDPPFYGRPIHVPPSPSFTSLITRTRPSTPDSSDTDSPYAKDSQEFPRNTPVGKVPTYEYYGFILYLSSWIGLGLYVEWAYLPSVVNDRLGFTYVPDRWWSVAVPAFMVCSLVYLYTFILTYNVEVLTPDLDDLACVSDHYANICRESDLWAGGTDAVMDIPLGEVSQILYG